MASSISSQKANARSTRKNPLLWRKPKGVRVRVDAGQWGIINADDEKLWMGAGDNRRREKR